MQIAITKTKDACEVRLSERLTFSDSSEFRTILDDLRDSHPKSCVMNFSDLVAIDSAGLGMLILVIDLAKAGGWPLKFAGVRGQVKQLLLLSRMDRLVAVEN